MTTTKACNSKSRRRGEKLSSEELTNTLAQIPDSVYWKSLFSWRQDFESKKSSFEKLQSELDQKFGNIILDCGNRRCDGTTSARSFEEVGTLDQSISLKSVVQSTSDSLKKVDHHVKKIVPIFAREKPHLKAKRSQQTGDQRWHHEDHSFGDSGYYRSDRHSVDGGYHCTDNKYEDPAIVQKWISDSPPVFTATGDSQFRYKEPLGTYNTTAPLIDYLPAKYIARKDCHRSVFANVTAIHHAMCPYATHQLQKPSPQSPMPLQSSRKNITSGCPFQHQKGPNVDNRPSLRTRSQSAHGSYLELEMKKRHQKCKAEDSDRLSNTSVYDQRPCTPYAEENVEPPVEPANRLYSLRNPTCHKHTQIMKSPFIAPDHSFSPKINKGVPRTNQKNSVISEVSPSLRQQLTVNENKRSRSCGDLPKEEQPSQRANNVNYPPDPDYIPPVLTRAAELSREYKKSKMRAKRKAEAADRKMLRRVKQTNRKICRFGYRVKVNSGRRSARRRGNEESYDREFLELPRSSADRTQSISSMYHSNRTNRTFAVAGHYPRMTYIDTPSVEISF